MLSFYISSSIAVFSVLTLQTGCTRTLEPSNSCQDYNSSNSTSSVNKDGFAACFGFALLYDEYVENTHYKSSTECNRAKLLLANAWLFLIVNNRRNDSAVFKDHQEIDNYDTSDMIC